MPVQYERRNAEVVLSTAESLQHAVDKLIQVASEMKQNGMTDAYFPWNQRHWDCLDVILTLACQCGVALPPQIVAKAQNRPSRLEVMQAKHAKDREIRKSQKSGVVSSAMK